MSITKNPFERPFRGGADKKSEPKPDVTTTDSKRMRTPEPKTAEAKKPVTHGGGLPPTRMGSENEAETPAPAGFQKVNPFHTPKHPGVSHTKPPEAKQAEWTPAKLPEDPSKKAAVATTAKGQEVIVPAAVADDFAKRVEESGKALAETEMTGDNYQKIYLARQQAEAEQREAERERLLASDLAQKKKLEEQALANTQKSRELMAKMASLQLRLVPNMDATEAYRLHGEIEEVRVALAQLQNSS